MNKPTKYDQIDALLRAVRSVQYAVSKGPIDWNRESDLEATALVEIRDTARNLLQHVGIEVKEPLVPN